MNQTSRLPYVAARASIALLFLVAGLRKALGFAGTVAYFAHLGLPMPELATTLSILVEIGGGLAFLFGVRLPLVSAGLAVFTLLAALAAHRFWEADAASFNNQLNNFLKNIAIIGGFATVGLEAATSRHRRDPA
jgi:putative oxidoreductase